LEKIRYPEILLMPFGFRGILGFFPEVAGRVKGRFSAEYTVDTFADVLADVFDNTSKNQLAKAKTSARLVQETLSSAMTKGFRL
jgi:hypothetical protein